MITALADPAQLPSQLDDQETFDTKMANYFDGLVERARQENDLLGSVSALLAGGAFALPYAFDTATADAAPSGRLRLSSATQNASTIMRLSNTAGTQDVTSIINTFNAATSGVKGTIRVVSISDPSKWLMFNVTARAAQSGYQNLTVVPIGGSAASPFAQSEGVLLFFQRNGDLASVLPNGQIVIASYPITTPTTAINFLTAFNQYLECSKFTLEFEGVKGSGATTLRVAVNGALAASDYYTPTIHGGSFSADSKIDLYSGAAASFGWSGTVDIRNARGTNSATGIGIRGHGGVTGSTGSGVQLTEGLYTGTSALSGVGIANSSFTGGTIHLIGHRTKL